MISLIVPTRNRAHTLKKVLPSYFGQPKISELIFVIDDGTDDTPAVIAEVARQYSEKKCLVIRNERRLGASVSRNAGVAQSSNEFIMFCDDDEYLEDGYAQTCLDKLKASGAAAISGRRVYMLGAETPAQAVARFGKGMRAGPIFRPVVCEYVNAARFSEDVELPFTNAIILTTKELLQKYPFDGFYSRGNGYREETDFQMNLFVHGLRILVTNDCHSIHLPLSQVRTGGQRTGRLRRIYWAIYYTHYFFRKYYSSYSARMKLRVPRQVALLIFACFTVYRETLRPPLYRAWSFYREKTADRRLRMDHKP